MRRNTIGFIWLGGALLAAALYATGPERFVLASQLFLEQVGWAIADVLALVSARTFDALRAVAIAAFVVFLVLGLLAAGRGLKAKGALVVVSVLFLLLTGTGAQGSAPRWTAALLLAAIGAASMTRRLTQVPHPVPWTVGGTRQGPPQA